VDTPACNPKLVSFTNTSTGGNSYDWDFGNGGTSTASIIATNQYSVSGNLTTTFPVKLIVTSVHNCKDTTTKPFTVFSKPQFNISALPDSGCSPLKVRFNKIAGAVKYNWISETGNTSTSEQTEMTFINSTNLNKTFTVQLIAEDAHTCSDTSIKSIKVYPLPIAKFTAAPLNVFIPNQPTKTYNLSSGAQFYSWSFGDGGTSKEKEPTHTYTQPGEYDIYLVASTQKGCKDTAFLGEKVIAMSETTIEMPNAFTPNPSGSRGSVYDPLDTCNDIFHPNIKGTEKYLFSIYSRWGELLFETKDPNEGWDGYYKGKLCIQDVYIWKVVATFVDGKTVNKTGDVLLLR